jgi:hypothetical protein
MDKGGAPEGNSNARKGRLFYEQLRKILVQEDALKLRKIAQKVVDAAIQGEPWAIKEIMDRIDGKAIQATEITGADGEPLTGIQVTFVKPNE